MRFPAHNSFYGRRIKPLLDLVMVIIAMVVTLPLFLLVCVVLWSAHRGRIFFVQERVGMGEKLFKTYKFRTMNDERDEKGNLMPDEHRLTPAGKLIRKTSLDELPQLFNILRREMSFIGPRPLLPEYLPFYNNDQKRRHSVMPGITGLAQVNGRNLTTWEKRFELDVWYVDHLSFLLDCKIFFMTIFKIVKQEGISAEGHATMPKFSDYIKKK